MLKRASKEDLFTGDLYNMKAHQGIKDNTTIFYRLKKNSDIIGPKKIYSYSDFEEIYSRYLHGLIAVIAPLPNQVTNEFIFDLVLRQATIDDLKDTSIHTKLNQIYYVYTHQQVVGPFYINNATTSLFLENLVAKEEIFIPNERQHFKQKEYQKAG